MGICSESVKFAPFVYIAEKGGIPGYFVPLQCKACLNSMALPPRLQAQLLTFIESLEKGVLAHKYSVEAVCFLKVNDRIGYSILQNVKVPKRPLLIFPETGGGAAARECQEHFKSFGHTSESHCVVSPSVEVGFSWP